MENSFKILQWMPLVAAAIGAFFGGLAAFFVSQANERVKRHRKRWLEHRNAFVLLDYLLNEITDIIGSNRYIAELIIKSTKKEEIGIQIIWKEPHILPFDSTLLQRFLRIELSMQLFSYGIKIRRLNNDTETICRAYSEMRSSLLRKDLGESQYLSSLNEFRLNMNNLLMSYDFMDRRTQALHARGRAAFNLDEHHDKRSFIRFLFRMPIIKHVSAEEIESELERLKKEIAETQSKSRKENEEWLRNS